MKNRLFAFVTALYLSALLGGCAVHQVYYVTQPAQARPGSTIFVYNFTAMLIIDTVRNISFDVRTDSVLVAAALPSGWSVVSAEYFVDADVYSHFKLDSSLFDSANARRIFDSLKTAGDVVTASRAAQYDAVLDGRYDSSNTKDQFVSFLGLRGFHVPAGTPADTSGLYNGTLVYIKLVASCTRFQIACGSDTGAYNLGYFTSYDPNDTYAADDTRQLNAYSDSTRILITNGFAVERRVPAAMGGLSLSVFPNPSPQAPDIACFLPPGAHALLRLTDPNGRVVFSSRLRAGGCGWNGVPWPENGRTLSNGVYLLRLEAGGKSVSRRFVIAR
jgi:hypothetical protein